MSVHTFLTFLRRFLITIAILIILIINFLFLTVRTTCCPIYQGPPSFFDEGITTFQLAKTMSILFPLIFILQAFIFKKYVLISPKLSLLTSAIAGPVSKLTIFPLISAIVIYVSEFLVASSPVIANPTTTIEKLTYVVTHFWWLNYKAPHQVMWMLPLAKAIFIVLIFLPSFYIEFWVSRRVLQNSGINKNKLRNAVLIGNAITFGLLFVYFMGISIFLFITQ